MTIIAVKKKCVKNGKEYGPYPKDPEIFYRYRVYREKGEVKQEYLGKGLKPKDSVVQESSRYLTFLDNQPFCEWPQSSLVEETFTQPCDGFEEMEEKGDH